MEKRDERVMEVHAVARKIGKKWGESKKRSRWKVTDIQVEAIRKMQSGGTPIAKIARVLKLYRLTVIEY